MIITMNRPKRYNALSGAMLIRMHDAMVEASNDADVGCIILTGAGGNFCSGADLKAMAGRADDTDPDIDVPARIKADPDLSWKGLMRKWRPTKPLIAAVEGVAIAGGTELLLGTDIRVAGRSARFGISEARWSLYPMGASVVRAPRQIPYTIAADLLLTGRHVYAPEAKEIGLIGHVVDDGQALAKAKELAAIIGDNGPLAVEQILETLHTTEGMTEEEALEWEYDRGWAIFQTEDSKEGPRAFAEKRKPNFKRK